MSFNYQMRFAKTGRARFIAHLDTLSCLMRAVRRTGYDLAFTQGMRPKPILSLAMPLGVGVEGEDEICDFSLKQRAPLDDLARKLGSSLPQGIELKSIGPCFDRSKAASRVDAVAYRIELAEPFLGLAAAVDFYNGQSEIMVLRRRPKGDKEVDVKKYIDRLTLAEDGSCLEFTMAVTAEGTARPEEVLEPLAQQCGQKVQLRRIVRTAINIKKEEDAPAPAARARGRYRPRRRF